MGTDRGIAQLARVAQVEHEPDAVGDQVRATLCGQPREVVGAHDGAWPGLPSSGGTATEVPRIS